MPDKIIVYTTPSCPYCSSLKRYLSDLNIPFEEVDASQDPERWGRFLLEKTGHMAVPVLQIGEDFLLGFVREKVEEL